MSPPGAVCSSVSFVEVLQQVWQLRCRTIGWVLFITYRALTAISDMQSCSLTSRPGCRSQRVCMAFLRHEFCRGKRVKCIRRFGNHSSSAAKPQQNAGKSLLTFVVCQLLHQQNAAGFVIFPDDLHEFLGGGGQRMPSIRISLSKLLWSFAKLPACIR